MGKQPRRTNLKGPRACIFCLGGDLSHEHIWPEWMHCRLPESKGFNISRSTGREGLRVVREGQGSIAKQSLRVVCRRCNNGWMERHESKTRPTLEPMVCGQWLPISGTQQRQLALWVTMKAMVLEHGYPPHAVMSWEDRAALCEGGIPNGVKIFVGHCGLGGWESASLKDAIRVEFSSTVPPDSARKNVQITTIGLGMLLVHFVVSKLEHFDLDHRVRIGHPGIMRLWPLAGRGILWPPVARISADQATSLARRIDVFRTRPGVHSE